MWAYGFLFSPALTIGEADLKTCIAMLIEDRLENMRGGDAHGPERLFDVEVAFDLPRALDAVVLLGGWIIWATSGPASRASGPVPSRADRRP